MDIKNKISRRLLFWIFVWFVTLGIAISSFGYVEMSPVKDILYKFYLQVLKQPPGGTEQSLKDFYVLFKYGYLVLSLIIVGIFLLVSSRTSIKRLFNKYQISAAGQEQKSREETPVVRQVKEDKIARISEDQRCSLLLLSLLQREGRLVDFLEENLGNYDDAQIGAAVRSIQDNCQKTLNKYLAPTPVINQDEGEEVSVPAGFDPSTIKLTGNVSGEPPFKGVLQHRGWKSGKFNLPTVSGKQNPNIITPAEVEIS